MIKISVKSGGTLSGITCSNYPGFDISVDNGGVVKGIHIKDYDNSVSKLELSDETVFQGTFGDSSSSFNISNTFTGSNYFDTYGTIKLIVNSGCRVDKIPENCLVNACLQIIVKSGGILQDVSFEGYGYIVEFYTNPIFTVQSGGTARNITFQGTAKLPYQVNAGAITENIIDNVISIPTELNGQDYTFKSGTILYNFYMTVFGGTLYTQSGVQIEGCISLDESGLLIYSAQVHGINCIWGCAIFISEDSFATGITFEDEGNWVYVLGQAYDINITSGNTVTIGSTGYAQMVYVCEGGSLIVEEGGYAQMVMAQDRSGHIPETEQSIIISFDNQHENECQDKYLKSTLGYIHEKNYNKFRRIPLGLPLFRRGLSK